jgi:tRNA pseudouridine55 synthase
MNDEHCFHRSSFLVHRLSLMHGFLNIDKPAGLTSHDVVARIRRLARQKRVGHAGTLDPAATGVLVVAIGVATRLIEYVQDDTSKRYEAVVRLGATTTTDDADGKVLASAPVPPLEHAAVEAALARFRGPIMQIPPMYSALHHAGRRLHELAREGQIVERAPRPVTIERLDLLDWSPPLLTLDILCGKGTYIRALARDLGEAIGCGAHLHTLRRTAVGAFRVEDAVPLDALLADAVLLPEALLPPERAVADWPAFALDEAEARQVRNGLAIARPGAEGARARALDPEGKLLAVLMHEGQRWKPEKVFDWRA